MRRFSTGSLQETKHGGFFFLWSPTEAIIGHLDIAIIAMKEKPVTGQVTRQGGAWTVFQLVGNCSHGIYPTRSNCNKYRYVYKEILIHLSDLFHCKRPELWRRKNWLLLHYNALADRFVLQEELAGQQVTILPHPPYSPIFHHVISFSFTAWKQSYMVVDFSPPRRSSKLQETPYGNFLTNMFQQCFGSYTNIGRLAYWPAPTILRADVDLCKCMWIPCNACQSALQPWVSRYLLYNQSPPGVRFLNKIIFYRMGLLAPYPAPIMEDQIPCNMQWNHSPRT
jgi:hypothetical protein